MEQFLCKLCNREMKTEENLIRFSRPETGKQYAVPESCWSCGSGFCKAKEVNPDPVQLRFNFGD